MNKIFRYITAMIFMTIGVLGFAVTAQASDQKWEINAKVVFDNYSDYPTEIDNMGLNGYWYHVKLGVIRPAEDITGDTSYSGKQWADEFGAIGATLGQNLTSTYNILITTMNYEPWHSVHEPDAKLVLWAEPSESTDKHVSFVSLEYTDADNLKDYMVSLSATQPDPNAVKGNSVAQVINNNGPSINVTIHLRYNPDIPPLTYTVEKPKNLKRIDYLGDGMANPDTAANGENDYRLYLDVATAPVDANSNNDIVLALDDSGSMAWNTADGKAKVSVLREAMNDFIDVVTQNPNNRVSIIKFGDRAHTMISASSDPDALHAVINGFVADQGSTNYYESFVLAKGELDAMSASDLLGRTSNLIFVTDGEPNQLDPFTTTSWMTDAASIETYNSQVASQLNVDNFYGMYVDSGSDGYASILQTLKNKMNTIDESYVVMAKSSTEVNSAVARFASKISPTLADTLIYDELSEYASYKGNLKVTAKTGGNAEETLVMGVDYELENMGNPNAIGVRLLKSTLADTIYTLSFDIRASSEAVSYYNLHGTYPDIGEVDTDYEGNNTSVGMAGFYSNADAKLEYVSGGALTSTEFSKPVLQIVMPEPKEETIIVYKNLTGKPLVADEFEFILSEIDAGGNETILEQAKNDADGKVEFSTIEYNNTGTHWYTVKEITGMETGVEYDNRTVDVVAEVTYDGANLNVDFTYPEGRTFTNKYTPVPVTVTIGASKTLTGATLGEGEFDFILSNSGNPNIETVSNKADGSITFSPITFTSAGTYTYKIKEDASAADPNIVYDIAIRTVTIEVVDNNGFLEATTTTTPDSTFANAYVALETNKTIKLKLIVTGMKVSFGQYNFELIDNVTGERMVSPNDEKGNVNFNITYDAAGVYNYTVKQIIPEEGAPIDPNNSSYKFIEYMDYDETELNISVTVSESGGALNAAVSYPDGDAFYNKYNFLGTIK